MRVTLPLKSSAHREEGFKYLAEASKCGSVRVTASLHRKRLAHDGFGEGELWLRGVFD
jgi:hypothetical protein